MSDSLEANILKSLEDNLEFCREQTRKATYKSWVFSDDASCSAAKMAEAGFVFEGSRTEPDAVRCFLCNKHLDCWDEDDDPWAEHRKHAPQCSFAKLDKPEKSLTLSEFIDIRNEFIERFVKDLLTEGVEKDKAQFERIFALFSKFL